MVHGHIQGVCGVALVKYFPVFSSVCCKKAIPESFQEFLGRLRTSLLVCSKSFSLVCFSRGNLFILKSAVLGEAAQHRVVSPVQMGAAGAETSTGDSAMLLSINPASRNQEHRQNVGERSCTSLIPGRSQLL